MKRIAVLIVLGVFLLLNAQDVKVFKGGVKGLVTDAESLLPLGNVIVIIEGTTQGSTTDENGFYLINSIPVGSKNLKFQVLGYQTKTKELVIKSGKIVSLNVDLKPEDVELGEVNFTTDQGTRFEEAKLSVVSSRRMDVEEVINQAGGMMDVQRSLQSLPSVITNSDESNEVIVRGGNPGENLVIFDGIEVENISHFEKPGASGGMVSAFHNELLQDINFSAGGFSVKYGDKCSSVMDMTLREGSDRFQGNTNMNFAGVGAMFEGPFSNGNYILSVRKSYFDLIADGVGEAGMPSWWSAQGKAVYKLSDYNKLIFNSLYSGETFKKEDKEEYGENAGKLEKVDQSANRITAGLSLKSIFGTTGYNMLTTYGSLQKVDMTQDVDHKPNYYKNEQENLLAVKNETTINLPKNLTLNFGGQIKYKKLDYNTSVFADTLYWWKADPDFADQPKYDQIDTSLGLNGIRQYSSSERSMKTVDDFHKINGFAELTIPYKKFSLTAGMRADYFSLSKETTISPRFSVSYDLEPVCVKLAAGRFYQTADLYYYYNNQPGKVKAYYNDQLILGLDYLYNDALKITAEAYYKKYSNMPVSVSHVDSSNTAYQEYFENSNAGKGSSYGFELFMHKKLTDTYFYTLSYSYSKAFTYTINDQNKPQKEIPSDYDYEHMISLTLGAKYKMSQSDWYLNNWQSYWYSYLFPFIGTETELSLKTRYIGGKPYNDKSYDRAKHEWNENNKLNENRYPFYQRTDFRIDGRYFFEKINLVCFFEINNIENLILNRNNVLEYAYTEYGKKNNVMQFATIPVLGLKLEF